MNPAIKLASQSASSVNDPLGWISQWSRRGVIVIFLFLPSLFLLKWPFPWVSALRSLALGTALPLSVFVAIGAIRFLLNSERALWLEWASITLCFASLQAYIFNTALHPSNHFNLIGGLLQNADPSMYLSLADRWRRGIRVVTPQTTREFFPCFLASMLWLFHNNLKSIVSLFTLISGGIAFIAWQQVRSSLGWLAATLFLGLVFFFYRSECLGLLRTEQLGLWFALIAVALMIKGLKERRERLWNIGVFSLVMGLNTRAGAYFVLPLFVLYSGWLFRRGFWGWRSVFLTAATVGAAMLLNLICYWVFFGQPRPTSNFWLCFYGMLRGGNWVTALNEIGLDYLRTNLIARDRGLALLKAEPWLLARGFWRACQYVWHTNTYYQQPPTSPTFCDWMKWLTPVAASVSAIWVIARRKEAAMELFALLIFVGVILSLPFAPPWDGGFRVFAVTNPFFYLLPALLASYAERAVIGRLRPYLHKTECPSETEGIALVAQTAVVALLLFTIVIPLGLMIRPEDKTVAWQPGYCVPPPLGCPANKLPGGFEVHLIPDSGRTFVPWVRVSDFRNSINGNLEKLRAPWILDLFRQLPAGTTVATAFHSNFFVIATEKARTDRWSWRNPILNRRWHRITYDGEYPIPESSRQILSRPSPPPLLH